ncbi:gliding motility-associated C-terminal domain-containing protein [Cesiribacter andamanensis]|uniref:Gliding motility-associated C-terminal domain-containing protein n=1 Tax=Cesiribacter andamanensis AMV16 TaxID=1279009 RepID=M7N7H6_9BACT|nr:T9SS C-terminal target domain-containing protein [Cesiribacter andamanensis]EMR03186.1 hypothetical protein ADICEAN_01664 [Cesiribacter andamanensis AMV16]
MRADSAYITFLLLLLCGLAGAQTPSPKGRYTVDYTRGCAPLTITLTDNTGALITYLLRNKDTDTFIGEYPGGATTTIPLPEAATYTVTQVAELEDGADPRDAMDILVFPPTNPDFLLFACSNLGARVEILDRQYDYYEVQFGSTPPVRADAGTSYAASGQFTTAGSHTVVVRGRYENSPNTCGSTTKSITARTALPAPLLSALRWNPEKDSVALQFSLEPQVRYRLERLSAASGSYEPLFLLRGEATDTLLYQADAATNWYCYRIRALDACSGTPAASSQELCTAAFAVAAGEGVNTITYSTNPSFSGELQLLNAMGTVLHSSAGPGGSFQDANLICGQQYCYQLRLQPQGAPAGTFSTSTPLCVTARRTQPLPPLQNIATYWLSSQLVVLPQQGPGIGPLQYSLQNSGGARLHEGVGDSLLYTTTAAAACYRLSYADGCGNQASAATPFCPLYLSRQAGEPDAFVPMWTPYEGYRQGVQEYVVQELDGADRVLNEWSAGTATRYDGFALFTPADVGRRFRIMALPAEEGLRPSYSNTLAFELSMEAHFPNAFSPNGDGLNDEFKVLGKFVEKASLWVYNRWGELIFHSEDKEQGWDGTLGGKDSPAGPYVYKALVQTSDGRQRTLRGTVVLTR